MRITQAQANFLQSGCKTVLFVGGVGSGKSFILSIQAIIRTLKGRACCIVSPTYPMLTDVMVPTIKQNLEGLGFIEGKDFKYKLQEKTFEIFGNSLILRSGDDPDRLRGLNLHDCFLDEAAYMKEDVYSVMLGRLRMSEDGQCFIATTPRGGTNSWLYELQKENTTETIRQRTDENPFLPSSYIETLRMKYSSQFQRQELDGEFTDFGAGVIDPNWLLRCGNVVSDRFVRFWDLAVSIKTASDRSAGARCSVSNGNLYVHNIIYGKWEYPDLRKQIIAAAHSDGKETIIAVEEAGQQRGFIDDLKRLPELQGYAIKAIRPKGDKLNRALPWITRAELGSVFCGEGEWFKEFRDECATFTADDSHSHDDLIDAVSGAYQYLTSKQITTQTNFAFA